VKSQREESIHLATFPAQEDNNLDGDLELRYEKLRLIRSDVSKVLELARAEKQLGQSLEAKILIKKPAVEFGELLDQYLPQLPTLFIVSQVEFVDEVPANSLHSENIRNASGAGTMSHPLAAIRNIPASASAV